MLKLEIGSGGGRKDRSWTTVDVRNLPGVDMVCSAWSIPQESGSVDCIYSRHMIEHLTFQEAQQALREWIRLLKPGGTATIICPNRDYHIRQILGIGRGMSPGAKSQFGPWTNLEHGLAGLHGWQDHEEDVHKWSWSAEDLIQEMKKAGFTLATEVQTRPCDIHVVGVK